MADILTRAAALICMIALAFTLKKIHNLLKTKDFLSLESQKKSRCDEGTKNGPDRSTLLGHNFVYQETKPHGFYSSYFHQRISS